MNDPVGTFMSQWYRGPAQNAILSHTGTDHIPETHFADAMRFRSEEKQRFESLKELAAVQESQMSQANSVMKSLMGTVTRQREENSKLRQQRDDFSKFILDNRDAFRGGVGSVRVPEATGEVGGSQPQRGKSCTSERRSGSTADDRTEVASAVRGHERPGGSSDGLDVQEDSSERFE